MRNLKNPSGMKWNTCGLLLILPALFSISGVSLKKCEKKDNKPPCITGMMQKLQNQAGNYMEMDMFILGEDGFMGYIKTGDSNHTRSKGLRIKLL